MKTISIPIGLYVLVVDATFVSSLSAAYWHNMHAACDV